MRSIAKQIHVIDNRDDLADYVAMFRDTIATGEGRDGRKRMQMSRHLFYVEVDAKEVWHGTDLDDAITAYNEH